MTIMRAENEILEDFHLLSEYLWKIGKVEDLNKYKEDFSAFLLHANHIKAYDLVASFCKNKKVLDIGCFIGYGEARIVSQAKEVIAIDSDEKALEVARRNRFPNVTFKKMDAARLPFTNETFDIVIAFQLLEHIPLNEVGNFLYKVRSVLKENGSLFILTPNRKFRLMPFQRPFNPEHYQEFTAKGLLKVLKTTFEDVVIKGTRAKDWIEGIERKRVRKSPFQVYGYDPFHRLLNAILPARIKKRIKETKSRIAQSSASKTRGILDNPEHKFMNLFQNFSMEDFYLENKATGKSMDLLAICRINSQTK